MKVHIRIYFIKLLVVFTLLVLLIVHCQTINSKSITKGAYSHWVGDILYNKHEDTREFNLCDSTNILHSRSGLAYEGGKQAIKEQCMNAFQFQPKFRSFSGYVMIRFLVNCNLETGRFRIQSMDDRFQETACPKALTSHLLSISKELDKWEHRSAKNQHLDCSKYLNFKIVNGKIDDILH